MKRLFKIIGTIFFFVYLIKFVGFASDFLGGTDTGQLESDARMELESSFERMGYNNYEITSTDIIYNEKFRRTLEVNSRMGNLSRTAVVKMEALATEEDVELPGTYRAVFHQFEEDYWISSDLEVMIEVGDTYSMLEEWAKERLEYELDLMISEDPYDLTAEVLSDEKEENPIDGTSRNVTIKLDLQSDGVDFYSQGEYTLDFYKYADDQNFWTNGVINGSPMY